MFTLESSEVTVGNRKFHCRMLTTADIEDLHDLDVKCFSKGRAFTEGYFFLLFFYDKAYGWGLFEGDKLIAFIILTGKQLRANIATIDVHPGYRMRGIGKTLLKLTEEYLIKKGLQVCTLQVDVGNTAAIRLYHSMGYIKTRVASGYYSDGSDAYHMEKKLTQKKGS